MVGGVGVSLGGIWSPSTSSTAAHHQRPARGTQRGRQPELKPFCTSTPTPPTPNPTPSPRLIYLYIYLFNNSFIHSKASDRNTNPAVILLSFKNFKRHGKERGGGGQNNTRAIGS